MLIASGSKVNILKAEDWNTLVRQKAVWNVDSQTTDILKSYATCRALEIRHRFQTTINISGRQEIVSSFYVIDAGDISLLGMSTPKQLRILKLRLNINQVETVSPFSKIKDVIIKLNFDPNFKPVQQPLRRVPISDEMQVEEKLKKALKMDINHRRSDGA